MDWQEDERKKYENVWKHDFYREQSDGLPYVELAYQAMGCQPFESLIDWGCGKGVATAVFANAGLNVTGVDIAKNCLDPDVKIPLVVGCIWDPKLPDWLYSDYAFCTDVLEHVPPEHLEGSLENIYSRTRQAAYIQVCTVPDTSGKKLNPPAVLHLSVLPPERWEKLLRNYWRIVAPMSGGGKSRKAYLCTKGK